MFTTNLDKLFFQPFFVYFSFTKLYICYLRKIIFALPGGQSASVVNLSDLVPAEAGSELVGEELQGGDLTNRQPVKLMILMIYKMVSQNMFRTYDVK